MIPLIGELKNVLTGGRVIGPITDPSEYRDDSQTESIPRGDPDLTMGRSSLMEFYRCPKRWLNGYESEDSKSTEWGSLVDCLLLTPGQFKDRYAVSPEKYPAKGMECPSCGSITADSKTCRKCNTARIQVELIKPWDNHAEYCNDWVLEQGSREIIKNKVFQSACDAVKVLQSDPEIKALVECSQRQVMATASYQDEETGIVVPLKILIDLLPDKDSQWGGSIVDFKTSESAALRKWRSKVYQFNYDCQSALYLDVWNATTGEDRQDFRNIVQESYSPYQTEKRLVSQEFLEIGRDKYMKALALYCACLKSNLWPGYDSDCRQIDGWQLTEPEPWMVQ